MMAEILSWLNPWHEVQRLKRVIEQNDATIDQQVQHLRSVFNELITAQVALHEIASLETPKCSTVVRKAANIARRAL